MNLKIGDIYENGYKSRKITKVDPEYKEVHYITEKGARRVCTQKCFKEWALNGMREKFPEETKFEILVNQWNREYTLPATYGDIFKAKLAASMCEFKPGIKKIRIIEVKTVKRIAKIKEL